MNRENMTPGEITVKEIEAASEAARREGLVTKDTLDWFERGYKKQQAERGRKERRG